MRHIKEQYRFLVHNQAMVLVRRRDSMNCVWQVTIRSTHLLCRGSIARVKARFDWS